MAGSAGEPIVTDGLVLCLDAANSKSYPGSGTVWRDLSGNGFDAGLVNGASHSLSINGLLLDGVNDYISVTPPSFSSSYAEGFLTIEYWLEPAQEIYASFNQSTSGVQFWSPGTKNCLTAWTVYKGSDDAYAALHFSFGINGFAAGALRTGYSPPFLVDYASYPGISQLVIVKATYGCSYYVNGQFKKTGTQSKILGYVPVGLTGDAATYICQYFKGTIYSYKLYNRALTIAEIQQNFDATRSRYGL